ncbi:MAG: hypothetical protein ACYCTL_08465 [Acidimicrobiales bacterium]
MKRLFLSGVAAATLAGGMAMAFTTPAFAAESGPNLDSCSAATVPGILGVNATPNASGTSVVQLCLAPNAANPALPSGGSVTASGNLSTQSGYVMAQGGDANPGALAGYIGLSSSEGIVGCSSGDFQGTGDHVIEPIPPTGAPNGLTTGSCAVTNSAP